MNCYNIRIPLRYNHISNLDRPDFMNELSILFNKEVCFTTDLTITKGNFVSVEKCKGTVNRENDEFIATFESIYADNEEYAIEMAEILVNKVCYVITYLAQSQNTNVHYFHPKFTYRIRDMKCNEVPYDKYDKYITQEENNENKVICLHDSVRIKESLSMKVSWTINTEFFNSIFLLLNIDQHLAFIIESYYRALGEGDYISKFYNLFTIIEYIEMNFRDKSNAKQILDKEQKKLITEVISKKLKELLANDKKECQEQVYISRLVNRFTQLVSDATDMTRTEKLYTIIRKYFGIEKIDNGTFTYEITESKIKEFIDTRNSLFHAKKLSETQKQQLLTLTNELMLLCGDIIKKLSMRVETR